MTLDSDIIHVSEDAMVTYPVGQNEDEDFSEINLFGYIEKAHVTQWPTAGFIYKKIAYCLVPFSSSHSFVTAYRIDYSTDIEFQNINFYLYYPYSLHEQKHPIKDITFSRALHARYEKGKDNSFPVFIQINCNPEYPEGARNFVAMERTRFLAEAGFLI